MLFGHRAYRSSLVSPLWQLSDACQGGGTSWSCPAVLRRLSAARFSTILRVCFHSNNSFIVIILMSIIRYIFIPIVLGARLYEDAELARRLSSRLSSRSLSAEWYSQLRAHRPWLDHNTWLNAVTRSYFLWLGHFSYTSSYVTFRNCLLSFWVIKQSEHYSTLYVLHIGASVNSFVFEDQAVLIIAYHC